MGVTLNKVYECDLCGDVKGIVGENPPDGWLETGAFVRLAACPSCVNDILRGPVGTLVVNVAAGCGDRGKSDGSDLKLRATALEIAVRMIQLEVKDLRERDDLITKAVVCKIEVAAEEPAV